MKLLYLSPTIFDPFVPDGSFRACHGDINRDYGLCQGFQKSGWEVDFVVNNPDYNGQPFNLISPDQIRYEDYDTILICQTTSCADLAKRSDISGLKRHPNVGLIMDQSPLHFPGGEDLVKIARIGSALSPMMTVTLRKILPHMGIECIPWGCPTVDRKEWSDPYPSQDPCCRIFFSGVISSNRHIGLLNQIADAGFDVWLAALFHERVTRRGDAVSGLTNEERSRLFPSKSIHFLSDCIRQEWPNPKHPHGPVPFGSFWPWLVHASCAINFCYDVLPEARRSMFSVHTKIYDYLACGTSVVTETGFPNAGDVLWYSAGQVVPWNDTVQFIAAIEEECQTVRDSEQIVAIFQKNNHWDLRAKQWLDLFTQGIG